MKRKVFFAFILTWTFVVFSLSPIFMGGAQNGGKLSIEGDTEMIGAGEISGGGHLTWTFTEDKAKELRSYVIQMFDSFNQIPCYFYGIQLQHGNCYYQISSGGDGDNLIDEIEAAYYLELVDRWLTNSFNTSDRYRYYVLDRVDTLYEEVSSSTDGLLNTAVNSADPVVIKFIFNSIAPEGRDEFELSEIDSTRAIYDIFSVRLTHDFEEQDFLFDTNDWSRSTLESYGGIYSYWHGNETSGLYDDNTSSVTEIEIDLRYASHGNMSFQYMGAVADANDYLDVTVSADGVNWHSVLNLSQSQNTGSWTNFTFNFADNGFENFIGKNITMRMNFTSDSSGNDTGFFIDYLVLDAPSLYKGPITNGHVDYIVGIGSFSSPYVRSNSPHIIRLLAGEILVYSSSYNYNAPPGDMVIYNSFDALENPAILFIIMFICLWFMVSFPNRFYSDYKLALEPKERYKAEKIQWLHWLGRFMILFLLLFYFFPTMFAGIGLNIYIGGVAMIILSILFLASISLTAKYLYDKKIAEIPAPEHVPDAAEPAVPLAPVPVGEHIVCLSCLGELTEAEAVKCECGVYYHPACASKIDGCQACGRPLGEESKDEDKVPVQCPSCTEIAVIADDADLMKEKCPKCGSIMKKFDQGYNYLIIAETPDPAYAILGTYISRRIPALALSTTPKEKLVKKYNLGVTEVYWITTMGTGDNIVDPKRLDFEIMRAISTFMKEKGGGIVLIDGVEYLISENGYEAVSTFLKKINDMASVNNFTILVPVNPAGIESEKLSALRREFDKVEVFEEGSLKKEEEGELTPAPKPKED
jgi:hypothetical protein